MDCDIDWELLYRNVDNIKKMDITQHEYCEYMKLISDIREQMSSYLNSDMFEEDDRYLTCIINHIDDTSLTKLELPSGMVSSIWKGGIILILSKVLSNEDFFKLKFLANKYAKAEGIIRTNQTNQYNHKPSTDSDSSGWGWGWGAFFGVACIVALIVVLVCAFL